VYKHIAGTALVLALVAAVPAQAGPMAWQQPYFTYSPGAVDFEDIEWTPLEYAAFSAYGGYFANIRRPRNETPLPELFLPLAVFMVEDEVKIQANAFIVPTFIPIDGGFQAYGLTTAPDEPETTSVPEPGMLALIGAGLLAASRSLRRRMTR
jgi:hypothetical protein